MYLESSVLFVYFLCLNVALCCENLCLNVLSVSLIPLVEASFSSYCRVDVLQELFANSPDFAFGRVNKSASGFVLKVV